MNTLENTLHLLAQAYHTAINCKRLFEAAQEFRLFDTQNLLVLAQQVVVHSSKQILTDPLQPIAHRCFGQTRYPPVWVQQGYRSQKEAN